MTPAYQQGPFMRALRGEPVERIPVWLMRQAGRYMPEYRAVRERVSFLDLCKTPDLAAEVSLQPVHAFGVDAAIIFSDILIPLEALGLPVEFGADGPHLPEPIREQRQIGRLALYDPAARTPFVAQAIAVLNHALNHEIPVLGFAGAPFTLACYAIEGGGSLHHVETRKMMFAAPGALHALLAVLAKAVANHLIAQARDGGAAAVQIFDTWGGLLAEPDWRRFSLPYLQEAIAAVKAATGVPVILYVNGASHLAGALAESGAGFVSADWRKPLSWYRATLPETVGLQGNLDPAVLYAAPPEIEARVAESLAGLSSHRRYIFNLGHGVMVGTPPENVRALVRAVHRTAPRD